MYMVAGLMLIDINIRPVGKDDRGYCSHRPFCVMRTKHGTCPRCGDKHVLVKNGKGSWESPPMINCGGVDRPVTNNQKKKEGDD